MTAYPRARIFVIPHAPSPVELFFAPPRCSIGLEICRLLGKSMHVIMGCRDLEKGDAAARALEAEGSKVTAHVLDITSDDSVAALAHTITDKHGGKLDVLINNAGFAYKGDKFGAEEARATIGVNVYGTMRLTDALLPFIKYVRMRMLCCSPSVSPCAVLVGYARVLCVCFRVLLQVVTARRPRGERVLPGWPLITGVARTAGTFPGP